MIPLPRDRGTPHPYIQIGRLRRCYPGDVIRRTRRPAPWWGHALLTFGLLLVALSVVGVHQLSFGRSLINAHDTAAAPATAMNGGAHHADKSRQLSGSPASTYAASSADFAVTTVGNPPPNTARLHLGDVGPTATPLLSGADFAVHGCTGCGGHTMSSMACLLA